MAHSNQTPTDEARGYKVTNKTTAQPSQVHERRETVLVNDRAFIFNVRLEFEGETANKWASIVSAPPAYTEYEFQTAVTEALNRAWNIEVSTDIPNENTEPPTGTPTFGGKDLS